MGWPGPRSAAPWAGQNEIGQGDASFFMSMSYHASVIEQEGGEQALEMLDMLGRHARMIYALLEKFEDL